MPAFYSVVLLIVFYAILAAEILIPSGGLLGLTAVVVAATSVIIGFTSSASLGLTLTLIYLITTPLLLAILIQVWPRTKIGRAMLNRDTLESDMTPPPPTTFDGTLLHDLVGRTGVAATNLLPSGQVKIDGHKTDAASTGLPIDAQTLVTVVRVHSGKLQVRAANEQEIRDYHAQSQAKGEFRSATPDGAIKADEAAASSGGSLLDEVDFDEIANHERPPTAS